MTRLLGLFFFALIISAQYIPPGGSTGGPPTGAAGGSLAGTYPNPSLATLAQDLLFTDATYDIGKTGATRPRDIFLSRNLNVGNIATIGTTFSVDGTTNGLQTTSKIGGTALNGLSGVGVWTVGVPSVATGTCNSSTVVAGDGICVSVSSAFSAITSGTNTGAAMVVGAGGTLNPTSATAGVINANQLNTVSLSGLATGLLKNTTTTGQPTIAVAGTDFVGGQASMTVASSVPRLTAAGLLADSKLTCSGTPVICTFYDDTASTGSTQTIWKAGAGQSGTDIWQIKDNSNNVKVNMSSAYRLVAVSFADPFLGVLISNNGLQAGSANAGLAFSATTDASATKDTNVSRIGAGVVGAGTGAAGSTAGSFRGGHQAADGTVGVTVTTCTGFKNGLCISGT